MQFDHYHEFADTRSWEGLPNAADVLSNLGFVAVGVYGLFALARDRAGLVLAGRSGYALFFVAMLMTAAGSSWYHLAPDNARLVWDRLPIALACAGLLAAVWEETSGVAQWRLGKATLLLTLFAVTSVLWWRHTDLHGAGDLRPYLLIQLSPLILIPLWQWGFGAPGVERRAIALAIACYVLAKLCELADQPIFTALGFISGHTLKHLFAIAAAWILARNLARRVDSVSNIVAQTLART